MTTVVLPVDWLLPDGSASENTFLGKPCARVTFSPFTRARDIRRNAPLKVHALIDTGCDVCLVDEQMVPANASPVSVKQAVTIHGVSEVKLYKGTFLLSDQQNLITLNTEYAAQSLGANPYRIMLGRHFLQYASFQYDGRRPFRELVINSGPIHGEPFHSG